MARKRLHGITQKRRKKPPTQALKRQESISRVRTTQSPSDFERNGELDRQDIDFLEAMRDMGVKAIPRPGVSPKRSELFQQVQFEASESDDLAFQNAMENLGVRPLRDRERSRKPPAPRPSLAATGPIPAAPGPQPDPPARETTPAVNQSGENSKAVPPPPRPQQTTRHATTTPTAFEESAEDRALLEALLSDPRFDPARKYQGAPVPPPATRKAEPRVIAEDRAPDGELDLHGKTLEEAIRMVNNFLMTSHRQRLRDVLIITGKGLNSGEGGPVLRDAVYHWLERNGSPWLKSFNWAPPRHGGDGALWLVLK